MDPFINNNEGGTIPMVGVLMKVLDLKGHYKAPETGRSNSPLTQLLCVTLERLQNRKGLTDA